MDPPVNKDLGLASSPCRQAQILGSISFFPYTYVHFWYSKAMNLEHGTQTCFRILWNTVVILDCNFVYRTFSSELIKEKLTSEWKQFKPF